VNGVAVSSVQATTPFILRVESGYFVASIRAGQAWITLIDDTATVLSDQQLSQAVGEARLPSIHADGSGFTALWAEGSDVLARSVGNDGKPSAAPIVVATTGSQEPRPVGASSGNTVVAAWMEGAGSSAAILESGVAGPRTTVSGWFPAVAASDGSFGVAWSNGGQAGVVHVGRFDDTASAVAIDGSSALIMSLAASSEAFYVGWEEAASAEEQIRLAKVIPSQGVTATALVSEPGSSANWPAVAFGGEWLAVAYYQYRDAEPSVYLTYFDPELGPSGTELEIAQSARYPSIAWGGNEVAIAYSKYDGAVEVSIVRCSPGSGP
jgi:hypothetical protein